MPRRALKLRGILHTMITTEAMKIRKATEDDIPRMMEIYSFARAFMAEHGNPNQWGPTNWPPEELLHEDIRAGNSYVCLSDENDISNTDVIADEGNISSSNSIADEGDIICTFFFTSGHDIEPTYRTITDGAWIGDDDYGVVHRIASDGTVKGTGMFCLNWAFEQCGHLRMDTHGDNTVMQSMLKKAGFIHCGTIYVEEDDYPRLAYEKIK